MQERLQKLFKCSAIYTIGNVVNRSLFLISMPIMTRYLEPPQYGILSLVNTLTGFLMTFYGLGIHDYAMRYYYIETSEDTRKRLMGGVASFLIIFALATSGVLSIIGDYFFPKILKNVPFYPYILIGIWTCFFASFETVPDALFRVRDEAFLFVSVKLIRTALSIALGIISVIALRCGAEGPLASSLIVSAASAFYFLVYLRGKASPYFSTRLIQQSLAFSLPILPMLLGSVLLDAADRIMLQYYMDLSVVAFYSVGSSLIFVIVMIAHSINIAWAPFYYNTAKDYSSIEAARCFSYATTYLAGVILFCALISMVFRKEIIAILAPPIYQNITKVVPVMMVGAVLNSLFLFPLRALFQAQKTYLLPGIIILGLLTNISLNAILIPKQGMMGAAFGTVGSGAVMLFFCYFVSQKQFPVPYQWNRLGKLVISFICCYLLSEFLPEETLPTSLAYKSIIILAFPGILFCFGFLEAKEKQKLSEIIIIFFKRMKIVF